MRSQKRKPLHFVGASLKEIRALPEAVQDVFGWALLDAQHGDLPEGSRPFGEGLPREVLKLVEDHDGDTYRAAYTVSFGSAVYVLHVFKKKSSTGIGTPRPALELIRTRLRMAEAHHEQTYRKAGGER
jgi:phage-related protein